MSQRHRFDRDSNARKARAQAHLAKVRGRHAPRARRALAQESPGFPFRLARAGLLVTLLAGGLGAASGDALWQNLTAAEGGVETIAVRGASRLAAADVAAATGIETGAPLGSIDAEAVRQTLAEHDWIGEARVLPLPSGAVVVDVREREPVATVTVGGQRYAVDASGEPFATLADDALPALVRLSPGSEVSPGEPSPDLATAARLARRLPALGMAEPSEVRIAAEGDPEGFALTLDALGARVVLGRSELDARLESLARLLAARPDVVAEATSIDLRFADQVVLRSEPAQEGSANQATGRGRVRSQNLQPTG